MWPCFVGRVFHIVASQGYDVMLNTAKNGFPQAQCDMNV